MRLVVCLLAIGVSALAQQNRGYYRYPTIHGNTIVFTSEGDLWSIAIDGGVARVADDAPG